MIERKPAVAAESGSSGLRPQQRVTVKVFGTTIYNVYRLATKRASLSA